MVVENEGRPKVLVPPPDGRYRDADCDEGSPHGHYRMDGYRRATRLGLIIGSERTRSSTGRRNAIERVKISANLRGEEASR